MMSDFNKTISGTLSKTFLRHERDRLTHGGLGRENRSVLDEFPRHVADKAVTVQANVEQREDHDRQLALVKAWIRERCRYEEIVELIERRLFDNEAYSDLSRDSGLSEETLRSWVSRVLDYLRPSIVDLNEQGPNVCR